MELLVRPGITLSREYHTLPPTRERIAGGTSLLNKYKQVFVFGEYESVHTRAVNNQHADDTSRCTHDAFARLGSHAGSEHVMIASGGGPSTAFVPARGVRAGQAGTEGAPEGEGDAAGEQEQGGQRHVRGPRGRGRPCQVPFQTCNPKPEPLNPQPSTLNPKP